MNEEYDNCQEAGTWSLIPRTPDMHILGCKWVFRTKLNVDGTLDKLKARLVAKGFDQEEGIDYLETYSHGDLTETVYMTQPAGFIDPAHPDYVCHLHKSLYGLKQSPRAWFDKFSTYLLEFGFFCSMSDPSLFIYTKGKAIILLLLYVDDMAITGNSSEVLTQLLVELNKRFRMKDLGKLSYFLGIQMQYHSGGLFLSQQKYAEDLLAIAGMLDCAPMPTPLPLTLTRPYIQFAVNFVCQKMHTPTISDFNLSDSDYGGCLSTRRSTGGFCTFLGTNVISWQSQKQETVAKSSLYCPPELYCDNLSSVYLTANPAFHKRSKHFQTHWHYVREQVALGNLRVTHIPNTLQLADIFTKSLPPGPFTSLRFKLGVAVPPTPSLRGTIKEEDPNSKKGEFDLAEKSNNKSTLLSDKETTKGEVSVSANRPKPNNTKMVWKPKTLSSPKSSEPKTLQRSPAIQQQNKDKIDAKETTRKLPKSKSISSCQSQDIILTNRFKCLEDEDQMLT